MADQRVTDLTALPGASLAAGDVFYVVDVSNTTDDAAGSSRDTTLGDLMVAFAALGGVKRRAEYNASVTAQNFTTTELYITGSNIAIPAGSLQAKSMYRLCFEITKTSTTGSTGTPIVNIKFGTAGTTADTTRCALTFPAQTAVADNGFMDVLATFRTVGSGTSAVLHAVGVLRHGLSVTGLSTSVSPRVSVTSGGFDSTVASSILGASVIFGASWAGSLNLVQAELFNLA
jgi:hypothetical protein